MIRAKVGLRDRNLVDWKSRLADDTDHEFPWWDYPVTICVAAICRSRDGKAAILGASDRRTTWMPKAEFDRPTPKYVQVGNGIVVFAAGRVSDQARICNGVQGRRPSSASEAARDYVEELSSFDRTACESSVLSKYGLTMDAYVNLQPKFQAPLAERIQQELALVQRSHVEAIICGFDGDEPRIFTVASPGNLQDHSRLGYAAVYERRLNIAAPGA